MMVFCCRPLLASQVGQMQQDVFQLLHWSGPALHFLDVWLWSPDAAYEALRLPKLPPAWDLGEDVVMGLLGPLQTGSLPPVVLDADSNTEVAAWVKAAAEVLPGRAVLIVLPWNVSQMWGPVVWGDDRPRVTRDLTISGLPSNTSSPLYTAVALQHAVTRAPLIYFHNTPGVMKVVGTHGQLTLQWIAIQGLSAGKAVEALAEATCGSWKARNSSDDDGQDTTDAASQASLVSSSMLLPSMSLPIWSIEFNRYDSVCRHGM